MPMPKIKLSPSMMCADFLHLQGELDLFTEFGIDWLHIDVMDGHYVPNFTLGVDICQSFVKGCKIPLDIHLMVERPDLHVDPFLKLPGTRRISFHPETVRQPVRLISYIREQGGEPGICIDPSHPIEMWRHLLPLVDQVMVMTVNPGYAGQKLIPFCVDKLTEYRTYRDTHGLRYDIEVDGNVSWENIPPMVTAGAEILVAGTSSIFCKKGTPRGESLQRMQALLAGLK
ncbi:MAG: ribulose-phosphate 3-epimerase [Verrucomicrobiota bacterium]|nr:ribulose-phosphate 3-epimerase [Verrucomicrobiota bacterium]